MLLCVHHDARAPCNPIIDESACKGLSYTWVFSPLFVLETANALQV